MKRRYDLQVIDGDTEYSINTYFPHKLISFLDFLNLEEKGEESNIEVDMELLNQCKGDYK